MATIRSQINLLDNVRESNELSINGWFLSLKKNEVSSVVTLFLSKF